MTKESIRNMENSELLAHLFNTRDNIITIRRKMDEQPNVEGILELFNIECEQYDLLQSEVYRRMSYAYKKKA